MTLELVLVELKVHGCDEYPLSVFQLCRILVPLLSGDHG